jgi:hypothetical protein
MLRLVNLLASFLRLGFVGDCSLTFFVSHRGPGGPMSS